MKLLRLFLFVIALAIIGLPSVAQAEWATLKEVRRFWLSVELTEFPVTQRQLFEYVGLPKGAKPTWGSFDNKGSFNNYALTDPENKEGYYVARIHYGEYKKDPSDIPILAVDVLFESPGHITFVAERGRTYDHILPELKTLMKKQGLSPCDFSTKFLSEEESTLTAPKEAEASVPTPTSRTPNDAEKVR